jgi:hypothetical protein
MSITIKKAEHTPGPWHVSHLHRNIEIESHQDGVVATLDSRNGRATAEATEANARLIAAAPELLACLRRMCGMYGAYSGRLAPLLAEDEGTVWTFERANGLACEAIAKAEGN